MDQIPRYQDLIPALVKVIANAGKPISNAEIELRMIQELSIPAHLVSIIHSGKRTELQYRLAWARTKAKSEGLIISPARETWTISKS